MVEIRWLVKENGDSVLQYRTEKLQTVYSGGPDSHIGQQKREKVWTAWRDVVGVKEKTDDHS